MAGPWDCRPKKSAVDYISQISDTVKRPLPSDHMLDKQLRWLKFQVLVPIRGLSTF